MMPSHVNNCIDNGSVRKVFNRKKLMSEAWNSDFCSVAAYYCSKLYPKEKRMQRARQLVRQFDMHYWNGTLNHLVWLLNEAAKKDELISISPDDVLEALEAEGLME